MLKKKLKYNDDSIEINYNTELAEDSAIEVSKEACFEYLDTNVLKYTIEEYLFLYKVCTTKCSEFIEIKNKLKISTYCNMSYEISHNLDKITLGKSVLDSSDISNYVILSKDINNYITQLKFCISILRNILAENIGE